MKRLYRPSASSLCAPQRARAVVIAIIVRRWLLSSLFSLLAGCGALQTVDEVKPVADRARDELARRPPLAQWDAPGAADGDQAAPTASPRQDIGTNPRVYSQDPLQLRKEVVDACGGSRPATDRHFLRSLVADLYFSGVDPATGTEALLLGNCGTLADILGEMVARGGQESFDPVVARAHSIQGPGASRKITAAARAGLARHAMMRDTESTLPGEETPAYGMVYFPSAGEFSRLDTAIALNRLYEDAIPGYGIYTFVLFGRGGVNPSASDAARYHELFRVIETYVSTTDENTGPSPTTPAFLIPISPKRSGGALGEQVALDLSEQMRRQLGQFLRHDGQTRLATSLDRGAGPFLVSALEPRLTPMDQVSPRLVADLSTIGPEYLYGIVDAYDRPIPPEASGRIESLILIRDRLLGLSLKPAITQDLKTKLKNTWVFMLGRFAGESTGAAATRVASLS